MNEELVLANQDDANAQVLCHNTIIELNKHYPGYEWIVGVDTVGGVIKIFLAEVSGQYGFILHIENVSYHVELVRQVKKAGGELLERYNLDRSRLKVEQVHELRRDFKGEALQA